MKYQVLKFFSYSFVLLMFTATTMAQTDKDKYLQLKNFPFLYMIEKPLQNLKNPPDNFTLYQALLHERKSEEKIATCTTANCLAGMLQFSDAAIELLGRELVNQVIKDPVFKKSVSILKRSGLYPLFMKEADTVYVRKAWQLEARGINYILNTYIGGQKPLYPKIDSISFNKEDSSFHHKVIAIAKKAEDNRSNAFYSVPLLFAIEALKLNERDEAARYLPLTAGENAAAFNRVEKIKWKKYPYSAILVPGLGPEQPDVKLDPNGAKRCDSAAVRYREGKAPFVVVSGGHVHPNKTPYCEAIEMKKYMVEVLHIPASAIIIEPHARHTTTNLRNTNRLLFLFKIPFNKPVMIVTDAAQNSYINGSMKDKVVKELGYTPFSSITKLSATETEYLPSDNSRQANSLDPLDP